MGKKKNKKTSKIIQFGQNDGDENRKYVLPIDEFDMHFLQLNYNKLKDKNNDNAVPVWSVQQNVFDNNYYEFEIFAESDGACHHGSSNAADETSTECDTAMKHTVTRLNTVNEVVDFTTYMKIVNVFNESEVSIAGSATEQTSTLKDSVVKDNTPEAKTAEHYAAAKLEVVNNNGHQVTLRVSSGEEVKVSMNNFHGFWTSGDRVQCRVCMIMVNDVEAHKMEIRHMKRIAPILKDVHCIRKIGPIFNHCVLCNEVIENIEFHLKANDAHTKQLEEALKLCKSMESQNNTVKRDLPNETEVAGTSTTDNSTYTSPSTIDSFQSSLDRFLILNKKGPIEMNSIKEAKSSSKPAALKNILSTNKSNNLVYCDVCDRKMHISTLKSHMEGKYHKSELLKKSQHIKSTGAGKNCYLPSVSGMRNVSTNQYNPVEDNFASIKSLEEDQYHKKMQIHTKFEQEKIAENKTEKSELKCKIGSLHSKGFYDKVLKNSKRTTGYQDGDRSYIKTNEQHLRDKNSTDNISTKGIGNTVDIEKIKYLMNEIGNQHMLECRVCHVTVPNTNKNAIEHINGTKHQKEYMFLLNRNKISKFHFNESILYCEACEVPVNVATELVHIETVYHRNMVATKVKDENHARVAASLTKDIATTEIPNLKTKADVQNKTAYRINFEDVDTSTQESFDKKFQKNLNIRIGHCNGDTYDDILVNALMDTFSGNTNKKNTYVNKKNRGLNSEMLDSRAHDVVSTKIADSRIQSDVQNVVADPRPKYDARNKITDPRVLNRVVGNNSSIQPVEKNERIDANDYGNINSKMTVNVTNVQYNNYNIQKKRSSYASEIKTVEEYSPSVKPNPVLAFCFKCHETVYLDIGNMKHIKDCCMTAIFYNHHISIEGSRNRIKVHCCRCGSNGIFCYIRNATDLYKHIMKQGHISRLKNTSAITSDHKICDLMSRYLYNTLRCQVCSEIFDNSVNGVMTHLRSDYHKSLFEKLLLGNKIVEIGGFLAYWCELCETYMLNLEQLYSHIYTDNHERKLNKTKNMSFMQKALISSGFFLICFITYKYFQSQTAPAAVPKPVENTFFDYFGLDFT